MTPKTFVDHISYHQLTVFLSICRLTLSDSVKYFILTRMESLGNDAEEPAVEGGSLTHAVMDPQSTNMSPAMIRT